MHPKSLSNGGLLFTLLHLFSHLCVCVCASVLMFVCKGEEVHVYESIPVCLLVCKIYM